MHIRRVWTLSIAVMLLALMTAAPGWTQVNTVDLAGLVLDPQGSAVPGAKVSVKNLATGATRSVESDATGRYLVVGLPPGRYELAVEAKGFARLVNPELILTIGQAAEFDAHLLIQAGTETVTVTESTELIEVRRTAVAETVDSRQITNLPINGRNYINFTLLTSQSQRDSAPSIGAAPTSGINFSGQRARSNEVSVDGADAVDNSVNGIRATVSQEAVQEFQLIISNYMPEFGRATGGVVNIVTKGGSNQVHGNIFGFLRHKDIQARNPFSVAVDPTTGVARGVKQAYTRTQSGATIGGPIKKDKSFYFFSYETTRRQETGFTNIGANNFGLVSTPVPADLLPLVGPAAALLTPEQAAFVNVTLLPASVRAQYLALAREASAVALNRRQTGGAATFITSGAPLPASFVGLNSLRGNYPVSEGTSLWSGRIDHQWNENNNSFVRVSVAPSLVTGIQVNAQNQNFGQNAGSRTSLQQTRDFALVTQHVTTISNSLFNEARFQYARRGLHYGFSQLPGGDQVAVNITGFAFFGREQFSTIDRIERRFQWTDNLTWIHGRHTMKFGTDINLIQLRSKKAQIFELNFGGLFNFGALDATTLRFPKTIGPVSVPGFTAVQAYGLGLPTVFIQGIGNSNKPFENKAVAFFAQDSWRIHPKLTLNYGVRYDVEFLPIFIPATALNAAAERALGVVEGIPRDTNNWSPRFGLAFDPKGNGKTIIRAGYGVFFDHPLLAVAFNSTTAEGALSSQLLAAGGTPSNAPVATNPSALNPASIFQGILNAVPSMGYLPSQQRFDPKFPNSIFTNQNFIAAGLPIGILPFTLPVQKDFRYSYAQQGNVTLEQQLGHDYKISFSYTYTHGLHLNRPRNVNVPDPAMMSLNFRNALAAGVAPPEPRAVVLPSNVTGIVPATATTCGAAVVVPGVLWRLANCPASLPFNGQFASTAAAFNFFRPSGPNPSFAGRFPGGYPQLVGVAALAGYPTGFSGVQVPYSDVLQQESSGKSIYDGFTLAVSKRFGRHFEFLSSWTWSHAIDDSTDLQTLLAPQDNRNPGKERSNSTFDQRHRWVTSAVFESPYKRSDSGWWRKFLADFILSPIVDVSSGRPFTVLTGTDYNVDFGSQTDRPSVISSSGVVSPFLPGVNFALPTVCDQTIPAVSGTPVSPPFGCTGNLSRNAFVRPGFATVDLRVSRKFHLGERWNLEFIADMFNLLNRFNVGDVNPLCDPATPSACRAGEASAALDPRQFQFALKLNF